MDIFRASIRSKSTLDPYERRLLYFLKAYNQTPDEFVELAKTNPKVAEAKIIAFISKEKARVDEGKITSATAGNCLKSIRLLLEMNDGSSNINWKKIKRLLPVARRYALDRIPTEQEIRKIVEAADIRGRALTLLLISSGIREGAVQSLKVGDLTPMIEQGTIIAGRLLVYAGDIEQYITFTTKEAYDAIQEYLLFRKEHGEQIGKGSPLFRDKFDPIKEQNGHAEKEIAAYAANVIPITPHAIRLYYNRLFYAIGIRKERKRRHEFSIHAFRKLFKTKAEIAGVKPINVETLMGHSTGISDSYYRPTETELLQDYCKAANSLTISHETQLMQENEKLKVENAEIEHIKKSYIDVKLIMETKEKQIDTLNETVAGLSDRLLELSLEIANMKNRF